MLVNEYAASNNIVTAAIACTSLIGQQQTSLDVAEREIKKEKPLQSIASQRATSAARFSCSVS